MRFVELNNLKSGHFHLTDSSKGSVPRHGLHQKGIVERTRVCSFATTSLLKGTLINTFLYFLRKVCGSEWLVRTVQYGLVVKVTFESLCTGHCKTAATRGWTAPNCITNATMGRRD